MGDQRSRSRPDLRRNDRFCVFPKREQPPQIPYKTDIYLGKGYFFLLTTPPGRGRNMVRIQKCSFFLGPKIPDFGPEIRFLIWAPDFFSELRPFSSGSARFAPKSLDQSHYGQCLTR